MRTLVVVGALVECDQGGAPCPLVVVPDAGAAEPAGSVASVDHHQLTNIATFGTCRHVSNPAVAAATAAAQGVLTPAPCVPMVAQRWEDTTGGASVGGVPLLASDSSVSCQYGGTITVANAGSDVELG